jgi:hypothetical protein
MVIEGGIEEAVQAGFQEGQFIQEGGLVGLVFLALLEVALAGEMLDVAAQGGGAEAELGGQGAIGHPMHQAEVDIGAGGVRADGTAFDHNCAPRKGFPHKAGWIEIIRGEAGGASTGETIGRELYIRREALSFPADILPCLFSNHTRNF